MKQALPFFPGLLLIAFLTFFPPCQSYAQTFEKTKLEFVPAPDHTAQFEWVDVDGDKDLDALVFKVSYGNTLKTNIRLYENKSGRFEEVVDFFGGPVELVPLNYAFGDYDHDGDVDFLLQDSQKLRLASNQGNRSFSLQELTGFAPNSYQNTLQWLDVDGDADLDIVYPNMSWDALHVYLNQQNGFTLAAHPAATMLRFVTFGDVNNDGLPDFVGAKGSSTTNPVFLYLNKGDGAFEVFGPELIPAIRDGGKVLWVDLDGDHDLDLFLAGSEGNCTLFRNQFIETGKPTFEKAFQMNNNRYVLIEAGDLNQDGLPDLVFANQDSWQGKTMLYVNQSTSTAFKFEEKNLEMLPISQDLDLLDLNGDQALDLFFVSRETGTQGIQFELHQSPAPAPDFKLLPPTQLQSDLREEVVLSWAPASVSGAVDYHVELLLNDKLFKSPLSLPNGWPLWPQNRQKHFATSISYRQLPAGTYKWRVQVRDAAGRASAFSDYQEFTIAPGPTDLVLEQPSLTRVRLNWLYKGPAGSGFAVFRRSANSPLQKIAAVPAGTVSFEDHNLMTNQDYAYLVRALHQDVLSAPSNSQSVNTSQFVTKDLPQRPVGMKGPGQSADLDQDGDYDLALLPRDPGSSLNALLKNDGLATFTRTELISGAAAPTQAHTFLSRDMDQDGDLDICAANGDFVMVFENVNGLFRKAFTTRLFQLVTQLEVADFNHDGLPDLLFSHATVNNTDDEDYQLLLQDKPFSFTRASSRFIPEYSRLIGRFAIGDLNEDGFPDILIAGNNYSGNKARIFVNQGGYGFRQHETNIAGLSNFWLADFNLDGHLDILQNPPVLIGLQVMEGTGTLDFRPAQTIEIPKGKFANITDIRTVDIDANGCPDLLVSTNTHVTILQCRADGPYEPLVLAYPANLGWRSLVTDFENDGDLDLFHEGLVPLFENRLFTRERPAPANLHVPQQVNISYGQKTKISWAPGQDAPSQPSGITYNILLKDATGKMLLHPETNEAGTFRYRLDVGNAGSKTAFELNNLPAGNYTVQVQSVNAAFQISAFSPPLHFEILPGPSQLSVERLLLNKIKLSWKNPQAGETQVLVERRVAEGDFEIIARLPASSSTFTDELLAYNRLYQYRISALIAGQPTAPSERVSWNTNLFVLNQDPGMPKMINTKVAVADFNNDSRHDLVVFGNPTQNGFWKPQETKVLENTPAGWVYHEVSPGAVGLTSNLTLFDFNGDHLLDIYRFGSDASLRSISELHFNQGNTSFKTGPSIFSNPIQYIVGWRDIDGDQDLDAYTMQTNSSVPWYARLLQNNGSGDFDIKQENAITCTGCQVSFFAGDFDRDGDEDLFQYGNTSEFGSGYYLQQNNNGKFTPTNILVPVASGGRVQVVDYNNDGWLDIFVLHNYSEGDHWGKSKLYKHQGLDAKGLPGFLKVQDQLPSVNGNDSDWVDFDHDGDLDFFIGTAPFSVFMNEGNDMFSPFVPPSLFAGQNQGRMFDFDQDGDLDIYLRGPYNNTNGVVLVNQIVAGPDSRVNQAPSFPANLSAVQDEKGMHLTWDPASDDHTPAAGLRYDVTLYRDGKAFSKASLDPFSGNRQKLEAGHYGNRATVNSLPVGAYTWKVQAVDASYQGSGLSVAGSFFFKPEAPQMNDTLIYRCGRDISLQAVGENIDWFQDAGLTVKLASGIFRPQSSQVVYVTQTQHGVRGIAKKVQITIFEKPPVPVLAASNRYTYCPQNGVPTLFFQASGEGVKWYADKDLKSLLHTGPMLSLPAAEKSYYLTQTIQNCESLPLEMKVGPVQINTQLMQSQDTLYAAEKNAAAYQWYFNNQALPMENKRFLKKKQGGSYMVRIFKDNCFAQSQELVLSVSAPLSDEILVFPNPTPGAFFVQLPGAGKEVHIRVTDALGRVVYQTHLKRSSSGPVSVPGKGWQKGIYFISISTNQQQVIRKVVKH
ncbi:MAG: FG-GAP-like repeat-containing protein [Adhaeribacter sp.]